MEVNAISGDKLEIKNITIHSWDHKTTVKHTNNNVYMPEKAISMSFISCLMFLYFLEIIFFMPVRYSEMLFRWQNLNLLTAAGRTQFDMSENPLMPFTTVWAITSHNF